MMQSTGTYDFVFADYPDIVVIDDMRVMLGNISKKSAYMLIKDKKIEAFKIGKEYRIPKLNILIYLKMT